MFHATCESRAPAEKESEPRNQLASASVHLLDVFHVAGNAPTTSPTSDTRQHDEITLASINFDAQASDAGIDRGSHRPWRDPVRPAFVSCKSPNSDIEQPPARQISFAAALYGERSHNRILFFGKRFELCKRSEYTPSITFLTDVTNHMLEKAVLDMKAGQPRKQLQPIQMCLHGAGAN